MTDAKSVLESAWACLYESAEIRDAGFRIGQLASIGQNGAPRVRTVVLRGVNEAARTIRIHTDIRSPKVAEIRANDAVSLIAYNAAAGEQIRLEGRASLHHDDLIAKTAWDATREPSRVNYRARLAPGTALSKAEDGDLTAAMRHPADPDLGFDRFCAIVITVQRLDWLDLATAGHRRAAFDWDGKAWHGGWIAP